MCASLDAKGLGEVADNLVKIARDMGDGETQRRRQMFTNALESLPTEHREIIEGYYFRGSSPQEIAAKMQLSPQQVQKMQADAMQGIREYMKSMQSAESELSQEPQALSTEAPVASPAPELATAF